MKTVIKYNTDKQIMGTETYRSGVKYKGNYVVIPGDIKLSLNKLYYIDTDTLEITSIDEPLSPHQLRANAVKAIKVTTSYGNTFDGDETSQDRMSRAIQIASITGATSTSWKLADNTVSTVSIDEMKEALALAAQEQSRLWFLDY